MLVELAILAAEAKPGYLDWGPIMINLNTLNLPQIMVGLATGLAAVAGWLQSRRNGSKADSIAQKADVAVDNAKIAVTHAQTMATTTQDTHALVNCAKDAADARIALLEERLLSLTEQAFVKTMQVLPPTEVDPSTVGHHPPAEPLIVVKDPSNG